MDEPTPIGLPQFNNYQPPIRKGKKKKRKTHGVLYVRNLRTGVKSKFKSTCYRREDNMTNVLEALMLMYCESPDLIRDILDEVKTTRRLTNKRL
jgi:uncharacterized protein (UPF0128 family)